MKNLIISICMIVIFSWAACEKNKTWTCTCSLGSTGENLGQFIYNLTESDAKFSCSNVEIHKEAEQGEGVTCVLEQQ